MLILYKYQIRDRFLLDRTGAFVVEFSKINEAISG